MGERGALAVGRSCLSWGARYLAGRATPSRRAPSFHFDGERIACFHHPYHYTWMNERAVEIALALRLLDRTPRGRVLEVGNVLGHYRNVAHPVVDKYERAPGVLNVDVVDVPPDGLYDLILSVSTLEHVGFDEEPRDPAKVGRAIEVLRELLAPGGLLWATLPAGYNPELDRQVHAGELGFTKVRALRRERAANRWREVALADARELPYDRLLFTAHGLLVCELRG